MLEFNKLERKIAERLGNFAVTPCVGVWIEISANLRSLLFNAVTPCVGVWIEISLVYRRRYCCYGSLPVWECGLKFRGRVASAEVSPVTPCVGVWIEIPAITRLPPEYRCHSLCGSVD